MVKNKIVFFEYKDTKFKYEKDTFYFALRGNENFWMEVSKLEYVELYKALFN